MMRCTPQWTICKLTLCFSVMWLSCPSFVCGEPEKPESDDDKVGEVFGKPVYRDELAEDYEGQAKLQEVFLAPVLARYKERHKKDIQPTKAEIAAAKVVLDKQFAERSKESEPELQDELKKIKEQLAQPDLSVSKRKELEHQKESLEQLLKLNREGPGPIVAKLMLTQWKFQKHLYDHFGGGRLLFQQGGIEAFDAMHKWLEAQEKAGEFKIKDKKLRDKFYKYWTTQHHGPFLIEDPDQIKKFLEPEWATGAPAKATADGAAP